LAQKCLKQRSFEIGMFWQPLPPAPEQINRDFYNLGREVHRVYRDIEMYSLEFQLEEKGLALKSYAKEWRKQRKLKDVDEDKKLVTPENLLSYLKTKFNETEKRYKKLLEIETNPDVEINSALKERIDGDYRVIKRIYSGLIKELEKINC